MLEVLVLLMVHMEMEWSIDLIMRSRMNRFVRFDASKKGKGEGLSFFLLLYFSNKR